MAATYLRVLLDCEPMCSYRRFTAFRRNSCLHLQGKLTALRTSSLMFEGTLLSIIAYRKFSAVCYSHALYFGKSDFLKKM